MKHPILWSLLSMLLLCSCNSQLVVSHVQYQALRTEFAQPEKIPERASIAVEYFFNAEGDIQPVVYNLTTDVLTIDQSKSFVINSDGVSMPYYDPNVYTNTTGSFESTSSGSSFNLGGIAGALGVTGALGSLMGATTLNSSSTSGIMRQSSVAIIDQPIVNIGPKGAIAMSKTHNIKYILKNTTQDTFIDTPYDQSPVKFSVCINYSVDGGKNFRKLVTPFYVSSNIIEKVSDRKISESFYSIYDRKMDALAEHVYMFHIANNINLERIKEYRGSNTDFLNNGYISDTYIQGSLIDYQ